ncbi:MAG: flavodoxin-dependent (E)-4-hydroxy-3-methylbut-2-enyl-diphosphate synthase, partial [Alphaproteobacteria bacterium]
MTPAAGTPARARRRASRAAWIGGLRIGAGAPVAIEAALRPDPAAPGAVAATIAALRAVEEAGAGLARLACTTREAALLLGRVAPSCALPLVADVGAADPAIALAAIEAGARAVWIDPACQDEDALAELAEVARHWGCVIGLLLRGSRDGADAARAPSPPIARAQEAAVQARRLEALGCRDVVLALRLDDPVEAMAALRALARASDLPIALAPGQEAVPSALAIGLPLAQGIGDLVHLPHAADPPAEARAAAQAVRALGLRPRGVELRVEDGFARLRGDGEALVAALERRLAPLGHVSLDVALSVAPSPDPSGPAPVAGSADAGVDEGLRIACGGSAGMAAEAFVARVAAIVEDHAGSRQARDLRGLLAAAGADADPAARMWVEAAAALFTQYRGRSARIVWGSPLGEAAWLRLVGRRAPWQAPRTPGGAAERDEAATAVSTALGLAIAARASGERVDAIAVIDQAAMASGATIEAIRAARAAAVRLVVVLLDPTIDDAGLPGTVAAQLSRLVSSAPYLAMRDLGRSIVRHLPGPGYDLARRAEEFARGIAAGGFMFEELGAYYVGPVPGRRYDQLLPVLRNLADAPRDQPVLLHVASGKLPAPAPRPAGAGASPLAAVLGAAMAREDRATLVLLQARGDSAEAFAAVARAHGARCLRAGEGARHGLGLARAGSA